MDDLIKTEIVNRYCDRISTRFRFDADLSRTFLADLKCSVVFAYAFWSIPSRNALYQIVESIYELDPIGTLALFVCDVDSLSKSKAEEWGFDRDCGAGEAILICNGREKAFLRGCFNHDFRNIMRQFLIECEC